MKIKLKPMSKIPREKIEILAVLLNGRTVQITSGHNLWDKSSIGWIKLPRWIPPPEKKSKIKIHGVKGKVTLNPMEKIPEHTNVLAVKKKEYQFEGEPKKLHTFLMRNSLGCVVDRHRGAFDITHYSGWVPLPVEKS